MSYRLPIGPWLSSSSKSHLTNLTVGDTVLAAGPRNGHQVHLGAGQGTVFHVIEAVVANISGRQEKAFFDHPVRVGDVPVLRRLTRPSGIPQTHFESIRTPTGRQSEAGYGQRTVIWGEVTEKTDTRATGIYLGVKDGVSQRLPAFNTRMTLSSPAFPMMPLRSLAPKCWWRALAVSRIWNQTDLKPGRSLRESFPSTDFLRVKAAGGLTPSFRCEGYLVRDWGLMRDGPRAAFSRR